MQLISTLGFITPRLLLPCPVQHIGNILQETHIELSVWSSTIQDCGFLEQFLYFLKLPNKFSSLSANTFSGSNIRQLGPEFWKLLCMCVLCTGTTSWSPRSDGISLKMLLAMTPFLPLLLYKERRWPELLVLACKFCMRKFNSNIYFYYANAERQEWNEFTKKGWQTHYSTCTVQFQY